MRIILLDWPSFCKVDAIFSLEQMGHTVSTFFHKDYQMLASETYNLSFDEFMADENYDLLLSYNYYPIVSDNCKRYNLIYISIVYDNPYVMLYTPSINNSVNRIFLFDHAQYEELSSLGIKNVNYMPLAVNADVISTLLQKSYDKNRVTCDVSFVGALYDEDHNFFNMMTNLDEYAAGYLDAIMKAQLKISGYSFINELLTDNIIEAMRASCPYDINEYAYNVDKCIYGDYFINRKLSSIERHELLTSIARFFNLKFYTLNPNVMISNAKNMGPTDYYSEMPYVFANSKINLNISLRSIKTGIPLRAMDIMGAGGFLLTNYQADFDRHFISDVDYVYYTDENDMLNKIDYYLVHEDERIQIARNGHEKVHRFHNFNTRFNEIFNIVFPHF